MDTDQARAELAGRPTITAATASLQQVQDAVTEAVSQAAGGLAFAPNRDERTGGCSGPLADLGGRETVLAGALADRAVHDTWPAVLAAARGVAERNGFTELVVKVDRPDNHSVRFVAADGAYVDLATQVATLVRARTGCHPEG